MTFRFARHTNNLERITWFYTKVLGFDLIGSFKNHLHYDGVFVGPENAGWHLEFTQSNQTANHYFDEDDLLVFYPSSKIEFEELLKRIKENDIEIVNPKNPYWKTNGKMFVDPDGFRIVVSPLKITH